MYPDISNPFDVFVIFSSGNVLNTHIYIAFFRSEISMRIDLDEGVTDGWKKRKGFLLLSKTKRGKSDEMVDGSSVHLVFIFSAQSSLEKNFHLHF